MKQIIALIATGLLLTACGGKQEEAVLSGERVSFMTYQSELMVDQAARMRAFNLPDAVQNIAWSQTGGNATHALEHVSLAAEVQRAWRRNVGSGSSKREQLLHAPVVANGVVYTLLADGVIRALDLNDGDVIWRTKVKNLGGSSHLKYTGGLAVTETLLIATTGTGEVIAYSVANGSEVWRRNLLVPSRAAPTVHDGRVFVIGHNNQTFALKLADGSLLWTHNGIVESLTLLNAGAAAAIGNIVVVPYSSGEVYALDTRDGSYLWHDALALNVKADPFSALVDVTAPPVISGNFLYAVNHNGRLGAFDVSQGSRVWEIELSSTQQPWVAGSVIYVTTEQGQLVAIDREDGAIRWLVDLNERVNKTQRRKQKEERYWGAPIVAGGRVLVAADDGYALAISPGDGKVLRIGEVATGIRVAPVVVEKTLLFLTQDGNLVAYR